MPATAARNTYIDALHQTDGDYSIIVAQRGKTWKEMPVRGINNAKKRINSFAPNTADVYAT